MVVVSVFHLKFFSILRLAVTLIEGKMKEQPFLSTQVESDAKIILQYVVGCLLQDYGQVKKQRSLKECELYISKPEPPS